MIKNQNSIKIFVYLIMTLFCMSVIFCFSAQDGGESQMLSDGLLKYLKSLVGMLPLPEDWDAGFLLRKAAHFAEFYALGASSCLLAGKLRNKKTVSYGFRALIFSVLYACTDEMHQLFVPERAASFSDLMIDSAGAAAGVASILLLRLIIIRIRSKEERK